MTDIEERGDDSSALGPGQIAPKPTMGMCALDT